MPHQVNLFEPEVIEWGIKRESLYVRQRKALIEMEEKENEKRYCSSSTAERSYQV